MKVVRGPPGGEQSDVLGLGNSRDVTAERVRVLNEVGAVLGAEDAMHQGGSVSMLHDGMVVKNGRDCGDSWHKAMFVCAVPTGLGFLFHVYPAPRRWAKIFRPTRGT